MRTLARAAVIVMALGGCEPPVPPPPQFPPSVVAEFDPLATPPSIPPPTDLAFRGGDGVHLNVPASPTDSPAQRAFNAYLRTLTGFPAGSAATAPFSGPLNPATATLGTP